MLKPSNPDKSLGEAVRAPLFSRERRLAWDAAVQAELAFSGTTQFLPVLDPVGRIIDFVCTTATASVTQFLAAVRKSLRGDACSS